MRKSAFYTVLLCIVALLVIPACDPKTPEPTTVPEKPVDLPKEADPVLPEGKKSSDLYPETFVTWSAEAPYETMYYGVFNDQHTEIMYPGVPAGSEQKQGDRAEATYTIYIPEHTETRSPVTIVLIPDGMKAKDFADSDLGYAWIRNAETRKQAVAFVEPENGRWNNDLSDDGRADGLAVYGVFKQINSDSEGKCGENAFYSLDKNRVSLVGYGEGALAALYAAAEFPAAYANLTLIDLPEFDNFALYTLLSKDGFPYLTSNTNGLGEIRNIDAAMPVFTVDTDDDDHVSSDVRDIYDIINRTHRTLDVTENTALVRTVKLPGHASVKQISDYCNSNGRYLGYPGGTVRDNITSDMPGFTCIDDSYEVVKKGGQTADQYNRFWLYAPKDLDKSKPAPLVLVLHGLSAALNDLISESRWTDIADEEGLVVCFCQGAMSGTDGKVVKPGWPFVAGGPALEAQFSHDIAEAKKLYNIDDSRIYVTGHSAGGMTLGMGMVSYKADMFAAYAINGGFMGGGKSDGKTVVPVIGLMAEYDGFPATYEDCKGTVDKFAAQNGLDASNSKVARSTVNAYGDGHKYQITDTSYTTDPANKEVPLTPVVRHVYVEQSPHVFMAEEARISWDFMKHWSRTEEGSFYDGKLVNPFPAPVEDK